MAIDLCDVDSILACNRSPDDEMFKVLLLKLLNAIRTNTAGAAAAESVVLPQVVIPEASLTNTFAPTGFLDETLKIYQLTVVNTTDADIELSFNGTDVDYRIPALTSRDITTGNFTADTDLQIRYVTNPGSGSVYIEGYRI